MTRICAYCGLPFDPYEVDADGRTRYCSDKCRDEDNYDPPEPDGESFRGGEAAGFDREQAQQWRGVK